MSTCQVRPWKELVPFVSHLENAYRARKDEDDALLPHSFLFRRRDCGLNVYLVFFFQKSHSSHCILVAQQSHNNCRFNWIGNLSIKYSLHLGPIIEKLLIWCVKIFTQDFQACHVMWPWMNEFQEDLRHLRVTYSPLWNINFVTKHWRNLRCWCGQGPWLQNPRPFGERHALILETDLCWTLSGLKTWKIWLLLWKTTRNMLGQSDSTGSSLTI